MKDLIGHTVKDIKITDNKTIIYFESGMSLHTIVTEHGVKTQYYVDLDREIIEL
jgi:hypothetical protein